MEEMNRYIDEYQKIYLQKQKIGQKPAILYVLGIVYFLVISLLTYLMGSLLNVLYNLDYLIVMFNIVVFSSYVVYKHLTAKHYKQVTGEEHSIWMINSLNYLYAFTIMTSATAFLSFSAFLGEISMVVSIILAVLAVLSAVLYYYTESKCERIVLPNTFNTILNGFFIAILFYALTVLIQVNNVPLSFAIVMPVMLVLIVIKRYVEKRYIIRIKRVAIVSLGTFLVILSFPFTSAFNYITFYRGEFTTRILYEELGNPVAELSEDLNGDALFYDSKLIIATVDKITFLDENFETEKVIPNIYEYVYTNGDGLYANKRNINNPTTADLYKYNGSEFVFVDSFYLDNLYDKVFLDNLGHQYFLSSDGYVYNDIQGDDLKLQSIVGLEDYDVISSTDSFAAFFYERAFMATPDSYKTEARGILYNRIAYHNDHLVFTYTPTYIATHLRKVHPDDTSETIYYLVDIEDYASTEGDYNAAVQLYKLFRLDEVRYYNGNYYLFGHVSYVNGTEVYRMYVFNDEGELQKEVIIDDDTISMNEDYIVYGEETLKVYEADADVHIRYSLVTGYGLFFFTMALVSVFSIKDIHLNPKRNKKFTI